MFGGYSSWPGRLRFDRGIGAILLLIPVVVLAMVAFWFWPNDPGSDVSAFGDEPSQLDSVEDFPDPAEVQTESLIAGPSVVSQETGPALVDVTTQANQLADPDRTTPAPSGSTDQSTTISTKATAPSLPASSPTTTAPTTTAPTDPTRQKEEATNDATTTAAPDNTSSSAPKERSGEPKTSTTSDATTTTKVATTERSTTRPTTATTAPERVTTEPPTTKPPAGTCSGAAKFERVFRDDFNGDTLGGQWNTYHSPGNAGFGLRRPSAISVGNGHLTMTAQMINGNLESGGMSHQLAQTYGMYKVRVRTDDDPSQATSGVIITWPASNVHPRDGENNIYETGKTRTRNPFYSYIHEPFGTVHDQKQFVHHADGSQFQVMTMEWTPERITITREGPGGNSSSQVHVLDENADDLIPDVPHRMTVQLDAWANSMSGVVRMDVDWLEIYKYCGS